MEPEVASELLPATTRPCRAQRRSMKHAAPEPSLYLDTLPVKSVQTIITYGTGDAVLALAITNRTLTRAASASRRASARFGTLV